MVSVTQDNSSFKTGNIGPEGSIAGFYTYSSQLEKRLFQVLTQSVNT